MSQDTQGSENRYDGEESPNASGENTLNHNYEIYRGNGRIFIEGTSEAKDSVISSPKEQNFRETSNVDSPKEETGKVDFLTSEINSSEIEFIDAVMVQDRTQHQPLPVDQERAAQMQQIVENANAERNRQENDPNWMIKAKQWVFTWNNPPEDWQGKLAQLTACKNLKIQFIIAEFEQGTITHTPHIQGYLRANVRIYYRTLRSKIDCYWEIAKGSEQQNIDYCTKEGRDIFKWGQPKTKAAITKLNRDQKIRTMQKDVLNLTWQNFEDKYPWEAMFQEEKWVKYRYTHKNTPDVWNGNLQQKNFWVWGPPGTGKSRWANSQGTIRYNKTNNKWWDNFHYADYDTVIIEDWPNDHGMLASNLKQWADRYRFVAEVKGGMLWIYPGQFNLIITSNYPIEQCFNQEDADAILRRFTVLYIDNANDLRLKMSIQQINERS